MMNFFIFLLACVGMTNVLVHGKILDVIKIFGKSLRGWLTTPKFLAEMLGCYECAGFWVGIILGSIYSNSFSWDILFYGFASSLVSQFYSEIIYLIRSKTDFELNEGEDD